MHKATIKIPGKGSLELSSVRAQIHVLSSAIRYLRRAPEIVKKVISYADSISSRLPDEADGLGVFIVREGQTDLRLPIATEVWSRTQQRQLHTCNTMTFFKEDAGSFPSQDFEQTDATHAALKEIQQAQDNCSLLVVPIRIRSRTFEEPMLEREFGFDLASGIYFLTTQSFAWQHETFELACEGERFRKTAIPSIGFSKNERSIRTLLPNQHEALSLTGFVV